MNNCRKNPNTIMVNNTRKLTPSEELSVGGKMKKVLTLMLAAALCLGMTACGTKDSNNDEPRDADYENKEIQKSVDAAAGELGLTGGEDTLYEMIGAKEGKEFNDGSVELYLFDEDSDAYKAIKEGSGVIEAAATNDGMVILTDDDALVDKFKKLDFE